MNTYNIKARVYPLIITLIPIVFVGIIYSFQLKSIYELLISLGITTSLFFLFSQIGRDKGKNLENELWKKWNGTPSTQILRFTNDTLDHHTKKRYHDFLKKKTEIGQELTELFENENLIEADSIYTSWSKYLISKSRDTSKYNLLFQENINYGFRRNLLGLKPIALTIIFLLLIGSFGYSYFISNFELIYSQELLFTGIVLFLSLLFWLLIVNEKWIKYVAFEYAKRLMETIDKE